VDYFYRAYGLYLKSQTAIEGLNPVSPAESPSVTDQISISIDEPQHWVHAASRLPAKLVYTSAALRDRADPAFKLSELGDGHFFHFSYFDGTQFLVDARSPP